MNTNTCNFVIWMIGICGKPAGENDYCEKHDIACSVTGCDDHAVTECPQTVFGLCCGRPVCDDHKGNCEAHH